MGNDNLISYEELRKIQALERDNKTLYKIDDTFFNRVKEYLAIKKKLIEQNKNSDNIFAKESVFTAEIELKNANKIIVDLASRRVRKIVMQALTNIYSRAHDTERMLNFEERFYYKLLEELRAYIETFLSNFDESKQSLEIKKSEGEFLLIRFLEDVPKFAWKDGNDYGPFGKEDVANLPKEISEFLINQSKAVLMEVEDN